MWGFCPFGESGQNRPEGYRLRRFHIIQARAPLGRVSSLVERRPEEAGVRSSILRPGTYAGYSFRNFQLLGVGGEGVIASVVFMAN